MPHCRNRTWIIRGSSGPNSISETLFPVTFSFISTISIDFFYHQENRSHKSGRDGVPSRIGGATRTDCRIRLTSCIYYDQTSQIGTDYEAIPSLSNSAVFVPDICWVLFHVRGKHFGSHHIDGILAFL